MARSLSDHAGTHIDAPVPFNSAPGAPSIDELPLEQFYTEASGEQIRGGDTVLLVQL